VVLEHAIEHAIGEGATAFDFLRGDERYKQELATGTRETRFLTVHRRTLPALAHRLRREHLHALKARLTAMRPRRGEKARPV
jgi:CelD/BcsL family acetyltransferase involved in cellulose biosynthesis